MGINRLLIDSRIQRFRQRTKVILKHAGSTDAGTGRGDGTCRRASNASLQRLNDCCVA